MDYEAIVPLIPEARQFARWYFHRLSDHCTVTVDELESEALWGLVHAVAHYDPEKGDFKKYAFTCSLGMMRTAVTESHWAPKHRIGTDDERLMIPMSSSEEQNFEAIHIDTDDSIEVGQTRDYVRSLVSRLDPVQQRVITGVFFEGLSRRKIAEQEGVGKDAICTAIRKAIEKLRAMAIE
jgi:RNA polymerase sigma factor (sigma-70 family)